MRKQKGGHEALGVNDTSCQVVQLASKLHVLRSFLLTWIFENRQKKPRQQNGGPEVLVWTLEPRHSDGNAAE